MGLQIRTDQLSPSETLYLQKELEHMQPEILEHKRPPRNFPKLFTVSNKVPLGAATYNQKMMRALGRAEISAGTTTAIPNVALAVDDFERRVRYLVAKYGWTIFEIQNAAFAGLPLSNRLAIAARDIFDDDHNRIFWNGAATAGLWGLLTHPGIPRITLSDPISEATATATLIAMLKDFIRQVFFNSETDVEAQTLVLPPNQFAYIADNYRSTTSDLTILTALTNAAGQAGMTLNVMAARELEGAGPNGEDICIAYAPGDRVMRGEIPGGAVFTQLAPQFKDFNVEVPVYGANGGVVSDYPLEMVIGIIPAS